MVLGGATAGQTAPPEPQKVHFETVDEVTLEGLFYPSGRGNSAPCALLLTDIGGSYQQPGWSTLAKRLQAAGFVVLCFDYRGHGGSTVVDPAFWKVPANSRLKGASPKKTSISYKDFPPGYLPVLVNDIAAAKRFLDLKNDKSECNVGNLMVVAAQDGATLATLWLAAESRKPTSKKGEGAGAGASRRVAMEDVAGAVWLSLSPTFGGVRSPLVRLDKWLPPLRDRVPMAFLYGEEDKAAAALANTLYNQVLRADVPPRLKHTTVKGLKTKAAGIDLVQKVPGTDEKIANYLQNVLEAREVPAWVDRETKKTHLEFVNLKSLGF
jgi:pimeloyl-ACP methyl ester carboxylesterase